MEKVTQLKDLQKAHMVGIKGTGMSGLALILAKLGIKVTGSDSDDSFLLLDQKNFEKAGIRITTGFSPENLPNDIDAIIASSSHTTKNMEIKEAEDRGIQILEYADIVGLLSKEFKSIAVSGSHGKTTTTNLLAHVLQEAQLSILPLAGPTSEQVLESLMRSNSFSKDSKKTDRVFIFEADEYQNKLQKYSPFGVILTNIELDHPDFFKSKTQYQKVFSDFISRIPKEGFLVYCRDDKDAHKVSKSARCKVVSYGFSEESDYHIRKVEDHTHGSPFAIHSKSNETLIFRTNLLGQHNILNATAVAITAKNLGISDEVIQKSFMNFNGSPRRLEKISHEPLIFDDYGHNPTEIRATLKALRSNYPDKNIWTVFHPHTYTRTKKFLKDFGKAFTDSDNTIVIDIYGSAREKQGTVHSKDVVLEIQNNGGKAFYIPNFQETADFLKKNMGKEDLLLTIGAGDIWKLHPLLK